MVADISAIIRVQNVPHLPNPNISNTILSFPLAAPTTASIHYSFDLDVPNIIPTPWFSTSFVENTRLLVADKLPHSSIYVRSLESPSFNIAVFIIRA